MHSYISLYIYDVFLINIIIYINIDEKGLKESFTHATEKVKETRQTTLEAFKIDLDSMTTLTDHQNTNTDSTVHGNGVDKWNNSSNSNQTGTIPIQKRPSVVKSLASTFDK